jgi:hypothetical protein
MPDQVAVFARANPEKGLGVPSGFKYRYVHWPFSVICLHFLKYAMKNTIWYG